MKSLNVVVVDGAIVEVVDGPGATLVSEVGGAVVDGALDGSVGIGVTPLKMSNVACDRVGLRMSTLMAPTILPLASGV
jgi:hypothetical protein